MGLLMSFAATFTLVTPQLKTASTKKVFKDIWVQIFRPSLMDVVFYRLLLAQ